MFEYFKMQLTDLTGLRHDSRAVTAMEYGLIAALVAVVVVTGLTTVGSNLLTKFNFIATKLQ